MQQTEINVKKIVQESMLAVNIGSGTLRVLATPVVAALFENAALQLAATYLTNAETTVGSSITVEHLAPTPLGGTVTVTAHLKAHEGRFFSFELLATDAKGIIAKGVHQRVTVMSARFQQKAEERKV